MGERLFLLRDHEAERVLAWYRAFDVSDGEYGREPEVADTVLADRIGRTFEIPAVPADDAA